jgi:transcription-repair coupling factor (superfamily II helicase)
MVLPEPAQELLDNHHLSIKAKSLCIRKVDVLSDAIVIQFIHEQPINPMNTITMIQSKRHIKMSGQDKLKIDLKYGDLH